MTKLKAYDLASLIEPIATDEFYAKHWERELLRIHRRDPEFFSDLLSLEEIDRVITSLGLHHPDLELTNAKERIDPGEYTYPSGMVDVRRLYQLFADGATIILPQMHHWVPELAHLCRAMEHEISARFQTNIYLTPGQSQGFKTHYDSHDVFVLQVSGAKRWRIYDTPIELPYRGQHFDPAENTATEIRLEFDMHPGDVLYLPRGVMHDASTAAGGSLHITLGVLFTSWTDLLVEALALVGLTDPAFRKGLPPGFARQGFDREEARRTFRELLRRFAESADVDAALDHFAADLISTRHPLIEGQMQQIMQLESLDSESRVGVRPHLLLHIVEDEDGIRVSFQGNEMRMPTHAAEPLRFALESPDFQVGDLPGELDEDGKKVLVERLIREGLLRFVE